MDFDKDLEVANNVRIRSILLLIGITGIATVYTLGLFLIPSIIIWIIAHYTLKSEIKNLSNNATEFARNFPFKYFGSSYGAFSHAFYYEYNLKEKLLASIGQDLCLKTKVSQIKPIEIKDVDVELNRPEIRRFYITESPVTKRGTSVTLLISFSSFGAMQTIQWWVLAGGYIDRDKRFNFIGYSPLTIWFWLIPYLRKNHDITARVRTIHSSTYNILDLETRVKSLHEVVFETLINILENHGIDTSSLKAQRIQAINISMSGGNFNMGDIIQNAKSKTGSIGKGEVR